MRAAAPHADEIVSTPEGRRQATQTFVTNYEHIPPELIAHVMRGVAECDGALPLSSSRCARATSSTPARITCPVRIVWGTADQVLPWPSAAVRFREEWLPHADWVELDGIDHCPQLDVPLETAQLILGVTRARGPARKTRRAARGGPTTIGYSLVFTRGDCRVFRGSPTPGLSASSLSGSGERHP